MKHLPISVIFARNARACYWLVNH